MSYEENIINRKEEVYKNIDDDIITPPNGILRYRYIGIVILIVIVVIIANHYSIKRGKGNIILNIGQINIVGLIAYLTSIIALFSLLMNIQSTKKRLTDFHWDCCHFCFYFFVAYFIPNNWGIILVFQTAWEMFEDSMGFIFRKYDYIETDKKKMADILSNNLGYFLGNMFFGLPAIRKKMDRAFSAVGLK